MGKACGMLHRPMGLHFATRGCRRAAAWGACMGAVLQLRPAACVYSARSIDEHTLHTRPVARLHITHVVRRQGSSRVVLWMASSFEHLYFVHA